MRKTTILSWKQASTREKQKLTPGTAYNGMILLPKLSISIQSRNLILTVSCCGNHRLSQNSVMIFKKLLLLSFIYQRLEVKAKHFAIREKNVRDIKRKQDFYHRFFNSLVSNNNLIWHSVLFFDTSIFNNSFDEGQSHVIKWVQVLSPSSMDLEKIT